MELINKDFIKIDRFDIFIEQIKASDAKDTKRLRYFETITRTLINYEKEENSFIKEFYINKNSRLIKEFINNLNLEIKRSSIINALIIATLNEDIEMSKKLRTLLFDIKNIKLMQESSDYILNNSIDINEYLDGEKEKIIYNDTKNIFERGYIYNNESTKTLSLTKKELN